MAKNKVLLVSMLIYLYALERDSQKDQAVVFIFIVATAGLLGWALIRPWVEKWVEVWLPITNTLWELSFTIF